MAGSSTDVLAEHLQLDLVGWQIQPHLNRLLKDGVEIRLEPRIMQVLVCLVSARGEPVTRDELMQRVWGHEYVTEDALNRAVSRLRKVLAEELHADLAIEAIPKTGYRLWDNADAAGSRSPGLHAADPQAGAGSNAGRPVLWRRWIAILGAVVLAAAGLIWQLDTHRQEDVVSLGARARFLPLTTLEGSVITPSLSQDGNRIAFAWQERPEGKHHIYVRSLSSETLLQISQGTDEDYNPAWSPDDTQIAFVRRSDKHCEVLSVSPLGGPARHLVDCDPSVNSDIAWSPDGTSLAFRLGNKGIYKLRLADGVTSPFTQVPPNALADGVPEFSPDGRFLAFVRWQAPGVTDVDVMPANGGEPRRLTFDGLRVDGLTWEADSEHIIYSSNRAGVFNLWRVALADGKLQPLVVPGDSVLLPTMSRDGRKLVYQVSAGQANVFSIDTRSADAVPHQVTSVSRWDWKPAVSPDGKSLVFASDRSGSPEIWVSDRDGNNALKLTEFGGPYTTNPSWSPDGKTVVFQSAALGGNFDVYVINATGGTPQRLTPGVTESHSPHYSADGRWIYYSSRHDSEWQIWRMPSHGGPGQQMTRSGGYVGQPGPDGTLYFSRFGQPGVWRIDDSGSEPMLVIPDLGPQDIDNWTIASGRIWYVKRETDGGAYVANHPLAAGGDGVRIVPLPSTYRPGLSVGPDGQVLFTKIVRDESNLMLMEP